MVRNTQVRRRIGFMIIRIWIYSDFVTITSTVLGFSDHKYYMTDPNFFGIMKKQIMLCKKRIVSEIRRHDKYRYIKRWLKTFGEV